jgi:FixJ family two-component response regulator
MNDTTPTVFIVDDNHSVLRSLSRVVRQAAYKPVTFSSADHFLDAIANAPIQPACLLLDLHLPGMNGLEVQKHLAAIPAACPIVFISGNATIPATVQAIKNGAVTFLAKPFDHDDLLKSIEEALEKHRAQISELTQTGSIHDRITSLTEREREVMAWVISGALNKQIAAQLGIVEKTVKVHRARVMEKMQAASVADLVRLCVAAGFESAKA